MMKRTKFSLLAFVVASLLTLGACTPTQKPTTSESESTTETESTTESENKVTLSSIALSGTYQTEFSQYDEFTYEGLVVTASYSDGTSNAVTDYTVSTPDMDTIGEKTVTVSYTEAEITKTSTYNITVNPVDLTQYKQDAILLVNEAFDELDVDDYSPRQWDKIATTLTNTIKAINVATTTNEIDGLVSSAIEYFGSVETQAEILEGTLFNEIRGNYYFDKTSDGHLLIQYDGRPGEWVYVGASGLNTNVERENIFVFTFRNNIAEQIQVSLKLTDESGSYEAESHIQKIAGNETKTFRLEFDQNVSDLYFFVDSIEDHNRVGEVEIISYEFEYEERERPQVPETKVVDMNNAAFTKESAASYTITSDDTPFNISRISAMYVVNFNGNDSSHRYYELTMKVGSNRKNSAGDFYTQSVDSATEEGVGEKGILNLEVSSGSKVKAGDILTMQTWYCADGLTFELINFTIYYSEWKAIETETVQVNQKVWDNGAQTSTVNVPYSSFNKVGRVSKMEITFESTNDHTWSKSQLYITGFQFTNFPSGNNNVLDIGPIMDREKTGQAVSGTMIVYPVGNIDLTNSADLTFTCWWTSGGMIEIKFITMYTDSVEPPTQVTNLEAHGVNEAVVLSWSAATNATEYDIYLGETLNQTVKTNYATVSGLTNETTYTFGVVAKNSNGMSTMVTCTGTPTVSGEYDQFIDGLNTGLEETLDYGGVNKVFQNSIVSLENNSRYMNAIRKMQNGEETTVAYIGGSITVGETSLLKDEKGHCKGYAYYSYQWLKSKYDVANKSKFVNAAISGTGSEIGIVRMQNDVIKHNPDIIFVEYAANNGDSDFCQTSYESLVKTFLSLPNAPAVILVFSSSPYSSRTEAYMTATGRHYNLPMFSFRLGFGSVCSSLDVNDRDPIYCMYTDIDDGLHPNDVGHQFMGKALANFLRELGRKEEDPSYTPADTPSRDGNYKFLGLVSVNHEENNECITSLGSFEAADTSTHATSRQSDVTAFQKGWTKSDKTTNEPMTIKVDAKNFVLIYEAGNPSVANDPEGNIVVTYVNDDDPTDTGTLTWDVSKTVKQHNSGSTEITDASGNGWQNPVGVLIFDKTTAATYTITIEMTDANSVCTIMAFGYTA